VRKRNRGIHWKGANTACTRARTPPQDGDEGVALESAEFWVAFCDADDVEPELLRPFLPRLIPLLLDKMVFEEFDEEVQVRGRAPGAASESGCWLHPLLVG
jgi:hypothetical protein